MYFPKQRKHLLSLTLCTYISLLALIRYIILRIMIHHFFSSGWVPFTHSACRHLVNSRWQLTVALESLLAQQACRRFYWQLLLPIFTIYQHWTLKGTNLNSIKDMVRSVAGFKASDSYIHIKLNALMES